MSEGVLGKSDIVFDAALLQNETEAMKREWLVTNGIGGYSSATLANANTRRYHALLVAALKPPVGRCVLLSKLEETLVVKRGDREERFELSANLYPGTTHPTGYRWLEEWRMLPAPSWTWRVDEGIKIGKQVWMPRGHNAVYVAYSVSEAPAGVEMRLELVPLLAWRDYHSEMAATSSTPLAIWCETNRCLRLRLPQIEGITEAPVPLHLRLCRRDGQPYEAASFSANACWYYRFLHPREQERGLDFCEDLFSPGVFTLPISSDQPLVVEGGVEPLDLPTPAESLDAVGEEQQLLLTQCLDADAFEARLVLATRDFLVEPPEGRATVIAGYHWFTDWGRDTMIALPGLCLTTGKVPFARAILRSFAQFVDQGMIPNRFPDVGSQPEYNTVDASLWFILAAWRVHKTGQESAFLEELWPALQAIIEGYRQGTRYNIHVDTRDHLLYAGVERVQLTWMDAKVGDYVVTPRIGKPVEINALWYNALRCVADIARSMGKTIDAQRYDEEAERAREGFQGRFARGDGLGLYDVLDTPPHGEPDGAIRPNQIFALSLPFPLFSASHPTAQAILRTVQSQLLTPFGLRTLAPDDPHYAPRYEGDVWHRDTAYHQGTAWPWLLGAFAEAVWKVTGNREEARRALLPLSTQMEVYGVGSLPEIYDGSEPQRPNGCIAQAWSVAEVLRVLRELRSEGEKERS